MIDTRKLQCLTDSEWLRGYAETLDRDKHPELIYKMNTVADLLREVWDEYKRQYEREEKDNIDMDGRC